MKKKIIAMIITVALVLTQLFVPAVFADRDDLATVVKQLDALSDQNKGFLLSRLWDYGIANIGNDIDITSEEIFTKIKNSLSQISDEKGETLDNVIISDNMESGDGKISKDAIIMLIDKLKDNKYRETIKSIYIDFEEVITKPYVKIVLNLNEDATSGDVFVALKNLSIPILTSDKDDNFIKNGDVAMAVSRKIGQKLAALDKEELKEIIGKLNDDRSELKKALLDIIIDTVSKDELSELICDEVYKIIDAEESEKGINLNNKIDSIAEKINAQLENYSYGITKKDVINVLDLYNLYEHNPANPKVESSSPADNATGVSVNTSITVTYDMNVYKGYNDAGKITLKNSSDAIVDTTNSFNGNKLTIKPNSSLSYNTKYTLAIPEGAVASEVMRSAEEKTITFTTASYIPPSDGGTTPTTPTTPTKPDEEKGIVEQVEDIIKEIKIDVEEAATAEELADASKAASQKLADAAELLNKIEDPKVAADLAETLIGQAGNLAAKLEGNNNYSEYDSLVEDIKLVSYTVMKNIGTLKVVLNTEETVEGKTISKVELGKVAEGQLVDKATAEKLDLIVSIAQQLNAAAKNAGIDSVVEPVLYIDAFSDTDSESASVEIPAELVLALEEKGISSYIVATDIATFSVPVGAIEIAKGSSIILNSEKADEDDASLSDESKSTLGDAPVFDLYITIDGERVENFKKLIGVVLPYTLKAKENAEKVTVYYINDDGELENIIGSFDEETNSVYFETIHFSLYAIKANNVTFTDVPGSYWASNYIEVMASKGIIKGIGGNKYAPYNNVTRAEFAAMIVREFKLFDDNAPNNFSDVSEDDWFYPEVTSAAKLGIVAGRPGGVFAPNDKITREEMAKMLANVLTIQLGKKVPANKDALLQSFVDNDKIADYAKDAVAIGVRYNIFAGKPDGTFAPKNYADRAEAAKLIYMLFYLDK